MRPPLAGCLLVCGLVLVAVAARAQPAPPDSLADLLIEVQGLLGEPRGRGEGDFEYRAADSFVDYVEGDSMLLRGHAVIIHRGARLAAPEIVYHRRAGTVEARAATDSAGGLIAGDDAAAVIRRGEESVRGERILYHLDTGRGLVQRGRVEFREGSYTGQHIRTLSEEEFHVHAGSYTTCDLPEPHFDFYSPRIKVLAGEMAIARPVYVRVLDHKVLWIPFYVFSLRQGRQSGLLTPGFGNRPVSFGQDRAEWEVRNLGYYLAPSDYWDLTLAADLRQRTGWLARAALAYAWRYRFDGRAETRIQSRQTGQRLQWEWWTSVRHSQELGPSASLRADGTFQSNKDFARDNSTALSDRLSRTLRSNLRFDKRWREAGYSFSASASHTDNLDADRAETVLPDLSLRSNRKSLFAAPGPRGPGPTPWYSGIYYEASARLRNARRQEADQVAETTSADGSLRLSWQQRPLPWVNLTGGLTESWRDADLRSAANGREGIRSDRLEASGSLSQTLYGMFYPPVGRVTALRHLLKPDAALSWTASRADTGGVVGIGGRGSSWQQSRRLNLRLSNSFWAKVLSRQDEERKVRLAQLNLSASYDFDRRVRPLSDLVTTLSAEAGRRLDSRLSLSSGFYDGRDRLQPPRLRQLEISTTLRLSGGPAGQRAATEMTEPQAGSGYEADDGRYGYESGLQQDIDRPAGRRQLQLSHYYAHRRGSPSRSWVRVAVGGTVRRHWSLSYSVNANLRAPGQPILSTERITAELLSVRREFHDWTATLNVEPSRFARERAFYFKAQLRDIPQIRLERADRWRIR